VWVLGMTLMIVSVPKGGKGVGLFVHAVMGNFPLFKILSTFCTKVENIVIMSNCCSKQNTVYEDCTENSLHLQSGEGIDMTPSDATESTQEQNVSFDDGEDELITQIPHDLNYSKVDTSQNVDLGDFLTRPVQIYEQSWQIGTRIVAGTSTFNPWYEYFLKTAIKKKLDNYYLLRCNLHLKFVVNASPFYYGTLMAAYQPMTNYDLPNIVTDASYNENVPLSQRPHVYIYPQNNQGGEIVVPFLYNKNWIDATSLTDLTDMGEVDFSSLTLLRNANGLTTESVYIKVYAWAEDIELAGPTINLALQAKKDEYSHEGTVSKSASAIARAAGKLSSLPVIGPFATATSYAAGAVGDIASLFGYTNVPVIDDVHAYKPKSFANLAATDIGTPVEKLTLDAKNELSTDAKIAGADAQDELLIKDFCKRESFIHASVWQATDAVDTGLFYARVSPAMARTVGVTGAVITYNTPLSMVQSCFQYWRGDIKFRIKFNCTKYHCGRVRINWDPIGGIGTSGDYTTETYTKIVDISQENEVEISIPYTQPTAYLQTQLPVSTNVATTSTGTTDLGVIHNGILTIRVLNEQTSPVASADIDVLVFVSGCDNLEFAGPVDIPSIFSPYAVQSGQYDIDTKNCEMGLSPSVPDPNINLVYMGESCVSLRQLMRRSSAYRRFVFSQDFDADLFITAKILMGRQPEYPGYDTTGNDTAVGLVSAGSEAYNRCNWNYTTWFSLCFIGNRGSYNYTINPRFTTDVNSISISRSRATRSTVLSFATDVPVTQDGDYERRFTDTSTYAIGMAGLSLVSQKTLGGPTVAAPMYSRYKMMMNNSASRTDGSSIDNSDIDTLELTSLIDTTTGVNSKFLAIDTYVAAGTDFSLVFFLNAPVLYRYSSVPVSV